MVSFKAVLRSIANRYGYATTNGRNLRDSARTFMIALLIAIGISASTIDSRQSFGSKTCAHFQQNWATHATHGSSVGSTLDNLSQAWLINAFENGGKNFSRPCARRTSSFSSLAASPRIFHRRKQHSTPSRLGAVHDPTCRTTQPGSDATDAIW